MNRQERLAKLSASHLYGIIDLGYTPADRLEEVTEQLLAGGLGILQLRAKGYAPAEIEQMAQRIAPICRKYDCLFIINDYPEIALKTQADGVHIGQDDGNLADVRRLLGDEVIIGRSTHSPEQAKGGYAEQADYIGFGPLFPTGTKPGRPAIGLEDIAPLHEELPADFPVYCIGGINADTLTAVQQAGAKRVVIVSWLLTHPDITGTVKALRETLGE